MSKRKSPTVVIRLRSFADIRPLIPCMVQLMGIEVLGADVDETVAVYDSPELPEENREVIVEVDEQGAIVVLITNNPSRHRDHWPREAPVGFHRPKSKVHMLRFRKGTRDFLPKFFKDYQVDPSRVAIIGNDWDRDIKPAIEAEVALAILVDSFGTKQFIGDKVTRQRRRTARKGNKVPLFEPERIPH